MLAVSVGAQVLKSMHPAAKMCTQGAGCTLNFEHCFIMFNILILSQRHSHHMIERN